MRRDGNLYRTLFILPSARAKKVGLQRAACCTKYGGIGTVDDVDDRVVEHPLHSVRNKKFMKYGHCSTTDSHHYMSATTPLYLYVISLVVLLGGCTETVSPRINSGSPFTVYGYLDPSTDTQTIRVIPIADTIDEVKSLEIDATVRTINLQTNETVVWQQKRTVFSDSTEGIVFTANFTPLYTHSYRLEVSNADGEMTTAETVVPEFTEIEFLSGENPFAPVFLIHSQNANLVQVSMSYLAVAMQPSISILGNVFLPVNVSYRGKEVAGADGLELQVDLRNDRNHVLSAMSNVCVTTPFITIRSAEMRFFVGDDQWVPPGGVFDADTFIQPGTFSNITNGYGYFGSGYGANFSIRLTASAIQQLGYAVNPPCVTGPGFNPNAPECDDVESCFE